MYNDNKSFVNEIKKYQSSKVISDKLHMMIYEMAIRIASKPNWSGYTWIDDMISDAYIKCIYKLDKFDPDKSSNAFSYFTTIIINFYIDYIKKFKKHDQLIKRLEERFKIQMEMNYNIRYDNLKGEKK